MSFRNHVVFVPPLEYERMGKRKRLLDDNPLVLRTIASNGGQPLAISIWARRLPASWYDRGSARVRSSLTPVDRGRWDSGCGGPNGKLALDGRLLLQTRSHHL